MGWIVGFEPTVSSATNWRFNQLSYTHHMARLKGLEPLTHCLEGSCSIHLSYKRISSPTLQNVWRKMERVMGIEPTRPAWKAGILPLNYTRISATLDMIPLNHGFVKRYWSFFKNFLLFILIYRLSIGTVAKLTAVPIDFTDFWSIPKPPLPSIRRGGACASLLSCFRDSERPSWR